jgi:UDP-N-acetylglucosamine acyltransferase
MSIHPHALVSPEARLGRDVTIGPFAIVEAGVEVGEDCVIEAAAQIRTGSRIGAGCFIGSGALVGSDPQFRGFDRRIRSGVALGAGNVLREYVTIHRSIDEGGETRLGDGNYLMAGAHVGHDALVGNDNTLANNVLLAGHVQVGNHCFLGGGSVFHQFIRIGDYVMTQGNSGFSLDLPPFVIASDINLVSGINSVGLRRAGFSREERARIKEVFREIYYSPKTLQTLLEESEGQPGSPAVEAFFQFLRDPSKKGLCIRARRRILMD